MNLHCVVMINIVLCTFLLQHHVDPSIGVYVIDRYTYYALEFLETVNPGSKKTMAQFVSQKYCTGTLICILIVPRKRRSFYNSVLRVIGFEQLVNNFDEVCSKVGSLLLNSSLCAKEV